MKPRDRAKAALSELEQAILDYLGTRPTGAINNEIARELNLETDFEGRQKNYLTYSVLGGLLQRGLVARKIDGNRKAFVITVEESDTTL